VRQPKKSGTQGGKKETRQYRSEAGGARRQRNKLTEQGGVKVLCSQQQDRKRLGHEEG